jgi:hypothetical protein
MLGDIHFFCRHVRTPNLLLCDGHEPHTGESIMAEFFGHQSDRLIIPGGCTSKLQPLDVSLKNMFHVSECVPVSYHSILVLGLWKYKFKICIVGCLLCGVVCGGDTFIYLISYIYLDFFIVTCRRKQVVVETLCGIVCCVKGKSANKYKL